MIKHHFNFDLIGTHCLNYRIFFTDFSMFSLLMSTIAEPFKHLCQDKSNIYLTYLYLSSNSRRPLYKMKPLPILSLFILKFNLFYFLKKFMTRFMLFYKILFYVFSGISFFQLCIYGYFFKVVFKYITLIYGCV